MAVVGRQVRQRQRASASGHDMLDKTVDPYVATRNAYLQQRQNSLQDGDGPAMIQQPLLSPFSDEDSDNADKTAKDEKK